MKGEKTKQLWKNLEYREKMLRSMKNSKKRKELWNDLEYIKRISESRKKLWKNTDYRKKMSEAHKGYVMPESQKEKIREANKGRAMRGSGYELPLWDRKKKSLIQRGTKHWRWKGGTERGSDWSWARKMCRERDNWKCRNCGIDCKKNEIKICVHHEDENIKNNSLDNLITLCDSCHHAIHKETKKYGRSN